MIAVDTNVVVRSLVDDEPDQTTAARELIARDDIFVSTSVLIEVEWVLRSAYGFSSDRVLAVLRAFAALSNVTLEDRERLGQALEWAGLGLDLADALHLASAADCDAFATFDKAFAKRARRAQLAPAVRLL